MFMAYTSPEVCENLEIEAGKTYTAVVEAISRELDPIPVDLSNELYGDEVMDGSRVEFIEELMYHLMAEAVKPAEESDIVMLVVGKDIEWKAKHIYKMKSMD